MGKVVLGIFVLMAASVGAAIGTACVLNVKKHCDDVDPIDDYSDLSERDVFCEDCCCSDNDTDNT